MASLTLLLNVLDCEQLSYKMSESTDYCIDTTLEKESIGYVVNIECSSAFHEAVSDMRNVFSRAFGASLYLPPQGSMHITVVDYLTTLASYEENEDEFYRVHKVELDRAIRRALEGVAPFALSFDTVELYQPCIIAKAKPSPELASIRSTFLEQIQLHPQTKRPPNIVHSTLVAFRDKVPYVQAQELLSTFPLSFTEEVHSLRLMRETKNRGQAQEIICEYKLTGKPCA